MSRGDRRTRIIDTVDIESGGEGGAAVVTTRRGSAVVAASLQRVRPEMIGTVVRRADADVVRCVAMGLSLTCY